MGFRKGVLLVAVFGLLILIVGGLVISGMSSRRSATQPATVTMEVAPTAEPVSPVAHVTVVPRLERATSTASPLPAATATPAPCMTPVLASATATPTPLPSPTDTPVSATATPTPLSATTDTPAPTGTLTPSPSPTATPAPLPTAAQTSEPSATPLPSPTPTRTPTPTATFTPSPLATGTPSATLSAVPAGRITGRVLLNGSPVDEGVLLTLEDQAYDLIVETNVEEDGVYAFGDLQASGEEYNVVFAQENTEYAMDQVISWGWIGPVIVGNGEEVELPDFEISLQGFGPTGPAPDAAFSGAALATDNPILFEWTAYPQATTYWMDLARGEEQELVWQSGYVHDTSVAFDGTLDDGTHIQPGQHWWGVGARRALGPLTLTVYGYLSRLTAEP